MSKELDPSKLQSLKKFAEKKEEEQKTRFKEAIEKNKQGDA